MMLDQTSIGGVRTRRRAQAARALSYSGSIVLILLVLASSALAQSGAFRVLNKGREGEVYTITDNLVRGKITVVDFASQACPACRALEPKLAALAARKTDLAIGLVMIDRPGSKGIDWQSPLARQYELRSVPYFKVYDPAGKLLAEGEPARKMIARLLIEFNLL